MDVDGEEGLGLSQTTSTEVELADAFEHDGTEVADDVSDLFAEFSTGRLLEALADVGTSTRSPVEETTPEIGGILSENEQG